MDPTTSHGQPNPTALAEETPTLYRLPEELLIKILDFAVHQDAPFDLEECIDIARNPSLLKAVDPGTDTFINHEGLKVETAAKKYPIWHDVHKQDWLILNKTCRCFRRMGRELFFSNRTCVVSQFLLVKLKHPDGREFGPSDDRPLYHPLLLNHVREIIHLNVNVVSASKFLKLPSFLKSFPTLKTCTLLLDHRADDDHIENIKHATVIQEDESGTPPRMVTSELAKLLVDIGMDEKIKLQASLFVKRSTESWQENMLRANVFPMLKQRKVMMSYNASKVAKS